jgi:hypothetical protein
MDEARTQIPDERPISGFIFSVFMAYVIEVIFRRPATVKVSRVVLSCQRLFWILFLHPSSPAATAYCVLPLKGKPHAGTQCGICVLNTACARRHAEQKDCVRTQYPHAGTQVNQSSLLTPLRM